MARALSKGGISRPRLEREAFATSRLLEFCSERELVNQTGHGVHEWPLVTLKELVDNALDATEEAEAEPQLVISVGEGRIVVVDNGPGIDSAVVRGILDYGVRVSSREAYVAPTRGAQGNALKSILAMPFALSGERAETIIEAKGIAHRITFAVDHLRQEPRLDHAERSSDVKIGTKITAEWPLSARSQPEAVKERFLQIADGFGWVNPHLSLKINWEGEVTEFRASAPGWDKWRPSDPAPAHWYNLDRLARLMAAQITRDQDLGRVRTVREVVSTFRGLTATAKQKAVLADVGASGLTLPEFFGASEMDRTRISALLSAMQRHSRAVPAKNLGVIGQDHLRARFVAAGAAEASFRYDRQFVTVGDVPHVIECAFGFCPGSARRQIVAGVNWSPGINNPFRVLGPDGQSLDGLLEEQRVGGPDEPVTIVIHMASPCVDYTDRGKSSLAIGAAGMVAVAEAIIAGAESVTKEWARQRKAEERDSSARMRRIDRLIRARQVSIKDVAYEVMERAYLKASANGTMPATARQVMYAARPTIQQRTGRQLDDQYFTQTLLPDYMREQEVSWNVVFDDRGHFFEPHTDRSVGLGTLAVGDYLDRIGAPDFQNAGLAASSVVTCGPDGRFGAVLFIEKEGFLPLLDHVELAQRYDLAIMSTKGVSNTAARRLVDEMCGRYEVPLLVLHDLDKAGFSIIGTLRQSNRRYEFRNAIEVIDLGLRLDDIDGLESESAFDRGSVSAISANLVANGATDEEVEFLLERRVELNAMSSDQLVAFIERKLAEHGIGKVVPADVRLAEAFKLAVRHRRIEALIREVMCRELETPVEVPPDLAARVRVHLAQHPAASWDTAVVALSAAEADPTRETR
jgi:DNA topoisomerase VI subunit B